MADKLTLPVCKEAQFRNKGQGREKPKCYASWDITIPRKDLSRCVRLFLTPASAPSQYRTNVIKQVGAQLGAGRGKTGQEPDAVHDIRDPEVCKP